MMQKTFYPLALLFFTALLSAQAPFTQKLYNWRIEKDLEYGTALNYAGVPTTLILDLYKPVGDNNSQRPLLVLVHGGSWLGGCKDVPNSSLVIIAQEMAQRGYVVASVNYRLGWHKSGSTIPNPINDATLVGGNSLYAADSAEIIRAIYRGQQDVKGAIRWLKARAALDSTCSERILVGGESAGAFLSLAVGFLDRPEEKPVSCMAISAAPTPASNVANIYGLNCINQTISPDASALQRPDLGPIDGTLNLNGHDANVRGVISFYGGVPFEAGMNNWLKGPDTPAVYLYHQTCDGIVPFGAGQPMFVISAYCNLGFTPWHTNYPIIYGNGALAAVFSEIPDQIDFITDFEQCAPFNPDLALFECIRFSQNGSYHFTNNPPLRAQKIADFFSPIVNSGQCYTVGAKEPQAVLQAQVSPNPFGQNLSVFVAEASAGEAQIVLHDLSGKTIWAETRVLQAGENVLLAQNEFPAGVYILQIRSNAGLLAWKMLRE